MQKMEQANLLATITCLWQCRFAWTARQYQDQIWMHGCWQPIQPLQKSAVLASWHLDYKDHALHLRGVTARYVHRKGPVFLGQMFLNVGNKEP